MHNSVSHHLVFARRRRKFTPQFHKQKLATGMTDACTCVYICIYIYACVYNLWCTSVFVCADRIPATRQSSVSGTSGQALRIDFRIAHYFIFLVMELQRSALG